MQQTIKSLKDNLRYKKRQTQRLENKLSNLKKELRTQITKAEKYKRLESELTAYKIIMRAEWRYVEISK